MANQNTASPTIEVDLPTQANAGVYTIIVQAKIIDGTSFVGLREYQFKIVLKDRCS